jgi:predicted Zn-dependent protease
MLDPPRKQTGPPATTGEPAQEVPPPSSTSDSLSHEGDPQRIGELLGDWLAIQMDQVDEAVAEAQTKAAAIPNQRVLWEMYGELMIRVFCLEAEVAELKRGRR